MPWVYKPSFVLISDPTKKFLYFPHQHQHHYHYVHTCQRDYHRKAGLRSVGVGELVEGREGGCRTGGAGALRVGGGSRGRRNEGWQRKWRRRRRKRRKKQRWRRRRRRRRKKAEVEEKEKEEAEKRKKEAEGKEKAEAGKQKEVAGEEEEEEVEEVPKEGWVVFDMGNLWILFGSSIPISVNTRTPAAQVWI